MHDVPVPCLPAIGLGSMLDFGPSKKWDPVRAVASTQSEAFHM
jgi:hypothetical protein